MINHTPLYIITGATGSIGREIALSLAKEGKDILLACRNSEKAETLKRQIIKETGNRNVFTVSLSLDSSEGVFEFIKSLSEMNRPVAALINNAGVMSRHYNLSPDGFEQTFQVNYLSTLLLTKLVLPMMEDGASVIVTTSLTHRLCRLKNKKLTDDLKTYTDDEKHFSQLGTYARSKRALTIFATYLSEQLSEMKINVTCADPGVVDTDMITMHRWFDPLANILVRPFMSSPRKGALSALLALSSNKGCLIFHHSSLPKEISSSLKLNVSEKQQLISDCKTPVKNNVEKFTTDEPIFGLIKSTIIQLESYLK